MIWPLSLQGAYSRIVRKRPGPVHTEMGRRIRAAFDVPRDEIETVRSLVDEAMRDAIPMSVPIDVGIGFGGSWLAAH
jgi:DNA polymerase I-like protein with 3'-5' exonuclease and polymerase domains